MADPTRTLNTKFSEGPAERLELLILTDEQLVKHAYVGVNTTTKEVEFATNSASLIPCGVVIGQDLGEDDAAGLLGDTSNKAVVRGGITVKDVNVTGVTAYTNTLTEVYASDGQTLTLTAGVSNPCGYIKKWHTGTLCDVYLYTYTEAYLRTL